MATLTRETLETLSIEELRHVDITNREDEKLVQEIMDLKRTKVMPPEFVGNHGLVDTDLIMTGKLSEKEAQKMIDEKLAQARGIVSEDEVEKVEEDESPEFEKMDDEEAKVAEIAKLEAEKIELSKDTKPKKGGRKPKKIE